jgi:hypothetical protein
MARPPVTLLHTRPAASARVPGDRPRKPLEAILVALRVLVAL